MPTYDMSQVEVAIIDTQPGTLRLLRDVLSRLGVKSIELYDNLEAASSLLTGGNPDVVLVDCDGPHESAAFRFIRSFRNELETPNPFAALIVTTWQATPGQLMRTTNSGADDLLTKPVSPKQVQERLNKLIEMRKKFVVTADYVGPDRRKSPREGTQIPLIDTPNTLRLKALGRWPHNSYKQQLSEANRQVNKQRRLRGSVQVSFLIDYAAPGLLSTPIDKNAVEHVARIPAIVDDMMRRANRLGSLGTNEETLCRAMHAIADKLAKSAENTGQVDPGEVDQAKRLARDLMRSMDPERSLEDMQQEVATAIAAYRSRLLQLAQAKQAQEGKSGDKDKPADAVT